MYTIAFRARGNARDTTRPNDLRGFQIGPKIRVGGSVGKIGQNVKNAVVKAAKDEGHFIGEVADNKYAKAAVAAALLASGAGAGAGAAILGTMGATGGALKKGGGLKDAITGGATGAATGAVAGGLGSKVPILSKAKGLLTGGGSDGKGSLGLAGDIVGHVSGGAKGGGGRSSVLDALLLGGGVAASAADKLHQQKLQDRAEHYAVDSYDTRAPLREKGMASILDPAKNDLSNIFDDPGNAYSRPLHPAAPVSPAVNRSLPPTLGTRTPLRRLSL